MFMFRGDRSGGGQGALAPQIYGLGGTQHVHLLHVVIEFHNIDWLVNSILLLNH